MVTRTIQIKRATTAAWAALNPVLASGEPGIDLDSGIFKIGDGTTAWLSLPAASGGSTALISDTAPAFPAVGTLWWDSDVGVLYVWYEDGTSGQWVVAVPHQNDGLAVHLAGFNNPHMVTATQVGLGNVDNTADADKPISTATQTALDGKEDTGVAATLDAAHVAAVDPHTQYALTDGTRGAPPATHYGQRAITNNASVIAITAAADSTLATNTDYLQITGIWNAAPDGINNGVTQQTNSITVGRTGDYQIEVWTTVFASTNNVRVALKFGVNGTISLGRRPSARLANAGVRGNISAHGLVHLTAGDVVTLWFAADAGTNVTFEDMVFSIIELRAT